MIGKIRENPKRDYFFLYSLISVAYGFSISEMGPVIPFLAARHDLLETDFGSMFMYRSVGFTIGNALAKFMHKFFTYHQLAAMGLLGSAIPHILFPYIGTPFGEGCCLLFSCMGLGMMEIYLSLALLDSHRGNNEGYWLQLNHGLGGIGCLLSPFLIRMMEVDGFIAIGLLSLPPIFFLMRMRSP